MYVFKKIPAKSPEFIKTKSEYKNEYEIFREYAQKLTNEAGKAKKKSGKARSYANYLIRLIIIYKEVYNRKIKDLLTFSSFKKIEKIESLDGYIQHNRSENHFYSATLRCYLAFVTQLNFAIENSIDSKFDQTVIDLEDIDSMKNKLINGPQRRKDKIQENGVEYFPRNQVERLAAKKRSNWLCEFDKNHTTFISAVNKKPYVEAHHLIPMAAQEYFVHTIDFADNIVSLCPTCHRRIHYAVKRERRRLVETLFEQRRERFRKYGINLEKKRMLSFYEIL